MHRIYLLFNFFSIFQVAILGSWMISPYYKIANVSRRVLSQFKYNGGQLQVRTMEDAASNKNLRVTDGPSKETSENGNIRECATTSRDYIPRFTGPALKDMTEEQREIRDQIVSTRLRTGLSGPFGPWLACPKIAEPAQELGRACRYGTSLSFRESELTILLTGAKTKSDAEFDIHQGEALRAGVSLGTIAAIPRDDEFSLDSVKTQLVPLLQSDREVAIVLFATELLETYSVSDETYAATKQALGEKDSALVEITSIVGYYTFVAYTLNVFRIPSK